MVLAILLMTGRGLALCPLPMCTTAERCEAHVAAVESCETPACKDRDCCTPCTEGKDTRGTERNQSPCCFDGCFCCALSLPASCHGMLAEAAPLYSSYPACGADPLPDGADPGPDHPPC